MMRAAQKRFLATSSSSLLRRVEAPISPQSIQRQLSHQAAKSTSSFTSRQGRYPPQNSTFLLGRQIVPALSLITPETKRGFYMWVENLFNAVDNSRFAQVGPNRAGSEFVFRMGGKVRMEGSELWLEKESELPAGNFTVEAVDLKAISLTDRGLENLKEIPSLKELDVSQTLLTGSSFKVLSLFPSLKVLRITDLTQAKKEEVQAGLALLAKEIPRCKVVAA